MTTEATIKEALQTGAYFSLGKYKVKVVAIGAYVEVESDGKRYREQLKWSDACKKLTPAT